jgi:predicted nuclease of predicted toxin-antitoxin system
LRFVLDNNVDARVRRVFVDAGHDCWRAAEAGLAQVVDDEVSVYADNMDAVLVTHDKEFTERRKKNTFGKHVRLTCQEPDACDVLRLQMTELIDVLEQHEELVVEVSSTQVRPFRGRWD